MDRNLALEFVRVTEAAAIAAAAWVGRGDKNSADNAAVEEMRARFNQIDFAGTVVIGEGAKDEAPELYVGEKVGRGYAKALPTRNGHLHTRQYVSGKKTPRIPRLVWDLAVDPLECTDSVAYGRPNAISVIVAGPKGSLMSAPDTYMEKLAVGPQAARVVDLEAPIEANLKKIAKAQGKDIREVIVMLLDRERNMEMVGKIRQAGARVNLISDGDVAAAVATCMPDNPVDALFGSGGSTEAVLAAAAVKILGGEIFCRFKPRNEQDEQAIKKVSPDYKNKIYRAEDLASGRQLTFTATGVIGGPMLSGVEFLAAGIKTHSVVMRASSGTIRHITTSHHSKELNKL